MKLSLIPVALCLFTGSLAAQVPSAPIPMTQWQDPVSHVTLEYPAFWKQVRGADDYCLPALLTGKRGDGPKPTFAVEFRGDGNYYLHTELSSLTFLFGKQPHSNPQSCRKLVTDASLETPTERTIHGVRYTTGSGGECGLGHSVDATLFTTLRGNTCYIFEEDFFTGRPDGARNLTRSEINALQRHLDAIMQSVTFKP